MAKGKGNPYSFVIAPRTELGMLIDVASGKEKIAKYDFVLRIVLEHFKEQFIEDYGEEAFNEYHYYLSIPSLVKKKQKKQEKLAKKSDKIKKKIARKKRYIANMEEAYEKTKHPQYLKQIENAKRELKELEA